MNSASTRPPNSVRFITRSSTRTALGGEQSRLASAALPERLTSFIGRDQELAALDELLPPTAW